MKNYFYEVEIIVTGSADWSIVHYMYLRIYMFTGASRQS